LPITCRAKLRASLFIIKRAANAAQMFVEIFLALHALFLPRYSFQRRSLPSVGFVKTGLPHNLVKPMSTWIGLNVDLIDELSSFF
jgi:hypothetical protein